MPIYAYRCTECGAPHEALQKMSEAPLTDCPACGKPALAKQVTAAGFQLKGSGWYVTDFRGGGASSGTASASSDSAGASTSTSSSASPATPAASAAPSTPASSS